MVSEYKRIIKKPLSSFFLFGMRGTGKSTWVAKTFRNAYRMNLLSEELYQNLLVDPALFARLIATLKPGSWVVVDEIQRLPQLLNEVHLAIEEKKLKFALLGSSARKIRRVGVNLLGGRALKKHLHPFVPQELGEDFSISKVLRFGSLPLIWTASSQIEQLQAYVQTYLKEEIQAEAIVRNLPGFARFLPVAALFHGQVLNTEGLARDAGVARTTVLGYLDILEDTLLAFRLPAFEGKLRVKEKRHPKLYWLDNGIARASKKQLGEPSIEEKGTLFEGLVAQCLRAYHELGVMDYDELYYWSTGKEGIEVDFLIKRANKYVAIEVKSGKKISPRWFGGLKAIKELKGVERRLLVYTGDRRLKHELDIEILPFSEFEAQLAAGKI